MTDEAALITRAELRTRMRDRPLRDVPRVVRTAMRLVGSAAPAELRLALGLAVVGGAFGGIQVVMLRLLLNRLIADRPISAILLPLGAFVFVYTANSTLGVIAVERQRVMGELVARHTQDAIAEVVSSVELMEFERPSFHNRLSRTLLNLQSRPVAITSSLRSLFSSLAGLVGISIALATIEPLLLLLIAISALPLWAASKAVTRQGFRFDLDETEADRRRAYVLGTLVLKGFAQEVRTYGLQSHLRAALGSLWDERIVRLREVSRKRLIVGAASRVISGLLLGGVIIVITSMYSSGRISLAEAGASGGGVLLMGQALGSLVSALGSLFENSLFLDDAVSFLEPHVVEAGGDTQVVVPFRSVSCEGVSFRYPSSNHDVLTDVSLTIKAGELVAIVGVNGSGKSTLAAILGSLAQPTAGRLLWNGEVVDASMRDTVRNQTAVLSQDFVRFLFPANDNIGLGRPANITDTEHILEAARRAGIDDVLESLPEGLRSLLGPQFYGGTDLSGGQWQRVALARAFFRDAPFLILDEPTSSLDAQAEHDLFQRLRGLFDGRGVVVISHRFSTVMAADRIVVMHDGRIIEQGSHVELLAQDCQYARLFRLQAAPFLPNHDAPDSPERPDNAS